MGEKEGGSGPVIGTILPRKHIMTLGASWPMIGAIETGASPELGGQDGEVGNEAGDLRGTIKGTSRGGREAHSDRSTSNAPRH